MATKTPARARKSTASKTSKCPPARTDSTRPYALIKRKGWESKEQVLAAGPALDTTSSAPRCAAQLRRLLRSAIASPACPIDDLAADLVAMDQAERMAQQWGQRYAELRAVITERMGAAEVATIGGAPVIRHTTTTQRRISAEAVRRLPAELVDAVTVETTSRRFSRVRIDSKTSA